MALTPEELAQLKSMMQETIGAAVAPIQETIQTHGQVLQGMQSKAAEPAQEGKGKGEEGKARGEAAQPPAQGPDPRDAEIRSLQRQAREAAFYRYLPGNIDPKRAPTAFKVLEADGRLVSRDGAHFIRMKENGLEREIPLEQGLGTWASTPDADIFAPAPVAGGSGSTPSRPGTTPETPRVVTQEEALGAILSQLPG